MLVEIQRDIILFLFFIPFISLSCFLVSSLKKSIQLNVYTLPDIVLNTDLSRVWKILLGRADSQSNSFRTNLLYSKCITIHVIYSLQLSITAVWQYILCSVFRRVRKIATSDY
jgi:hypothetical protein